MRQSIYFVSLVAIAIGLFVGASRTAISGSGQSGSLVRLQPSRPGVAQTGHINVSGNVVAGRVGAGTDNPQMALHVSGDILTDFPGVYFAKTISGATEPFLHPRGYDGKTYLTYGQNGFTIRTLSETPVLSFAAAGQADFAHNVSGPFFYSRGNIDALGSLNSQGVIEVKGRIDTGYTNENPTTNFMRVMDGERNCLQLYSAFPGGFPTLHCQNYSGGWATWFGGTMVATAKAFAIDHPLDPENKYLMHSCVESDEMRNLYDGTVILDEQGEATVTMPDWFEALNREFRYQLTSIGGPGRDLYVASELKDGKFSIAGGQPGLKVSWQVTGIRHDPYAEQHPIEVEVDKGERRGRYISPESYGLPTSRGGLFASERPSAKSGQTGN
ncbi:MAG TPA: hypothetical protein PKA27_16030 [Fimbriimonadaceae bacterium]|nr:hypothetical protein [Fimbriimonadaceae bacterium]